MAIDWPYALWEPLPESAQFARIGRTKRDRKKIAAARRSARRTRR